MSELKVLNRRQAAQKLGISISKLDRAWRKGELPEPAYVFGRPLWKESELEEVIEKAFEKRVMTKKAA